jgi:hypothetical protein
MEHVLERWRTRDEFGLQLDAKTRNRKNVEGCKRLKQDLRYYFWTPNGRQNAELRSLDSTRTPLAIGNRNRKSGLKVTPVAESPMSIALRTNGKSSSALNRIFACVMVRMTVGQGVLFVLSTEFGQPSARQAHIPRAQP